METLSTEIAVAPFDPLDPPTALIAVPPASCAQSPYYDYPYQDLLTQ